MTIEERNTKLKHFITCLKCEVSGKVCDDNCPVQYKAGNMGEIIENLEAISKALEQEPCEDVISRQAVLDKKELIELEDGQSFYCISPEDVETLPSVTPQEKRWISVSERLPDDSSEYLVTVINEDIDTYKYTGIAWYAHPKDYDIEEGDWRELMHDEKVIAWMPLPTPFESQESEE